MGWTSPRLKLRINVLAYLGSVAQQKREEYTPPITYTLATIELGMVSSKHQANIKK